MTQKLPQPQVKHGLPGSTGGIPNRIKAYGKMWDYEYATPDYLTAKEVVKGMTEILHRWNKNKIKSTIKIFYESRRPIYVVYKRWTKGG